ncbi:membrane peptidoglycan carboxypeptidase [Bradyrhizobium sp. AZCC 1578]|uniref:transglycosylase domain-containing protein n=1 Tax=Bradyrhizobium sp. AZCC 1578 TaxID=3117027 RepID=UPI002FEEB279
MLSIEDRRFYQHTITQQLVRLRGLVGREQSMNRKLREAFAALWLDFHMDKEAILTVWMASAHASRWGHFY